MHPEDLQWQREGQMQEFLEAFFGLQGPDPSSDLRAEAHTTLTRCNQPEFYADAPWRLEVDQEAIPLLFVVRDANLQPPALGPWTFSGLRVDQEVSPGQWTEVRSYTPSELPDVAADGAIETGFWVFRTRIPVGRLMDLDPERRGETACLRVGFEGRFSTNVSDGAQTTYRYLQIYLACDPLPLGRAASGSGPRHWFHGDTHYHSAFTNDIWEFGNPVRDARHAGSAIGLDWLIITDHSCDLDERDDGASSPTRWERLKQALSRSSVSDHGFRCILGEEITVRSGKIGYLHVLAIGGLDRLIEGGFWSDDDRVIKRIAGKLVAIAAERGGYPVDAVERLFDKVHPLGDALAQLPATTLAFAAHPQTAAQPPFINGTWDIMQLADLRLTGYELWNGRARHRTKLLAAPTDNPFAESVWEDPEELAKADDLRIKGLVRWAEENWDPMLQLGVDEWSTPTALPRRRPVFIAGSDAHGDFNYSVGVGWDYRQHSLISDNALGRARTVVYLPRHESARVPAKREILSALAKGACVVTDGPLLELSLRQGNRVTHLGEAVILSSGDPPEVSIALHTTPEFGAAEDVTLVTYAKGQGNGNVRKTIVRVGSSTPLVLIGNRGYCRAMVETVGPGGERFCCFTNPFWFWDVDGKAGPLTVRVTERGSLGWDGSAA